MYLTSTDGFNISSGFMLDRKARLGFWFSALYGLIATMFWHYFLQGQNLAEYLDVFLIGIATAAYLFSWNSALILYVISIGVAMSSLGLYGPSGGFATLLRMASYSIVSLGLIALLGLLQRSMARVSAADNVNRTLLDNMTGRALFMIDRDGVIQNWNAGAERLTSYNASSMLGQHYAALLVPMKDAIDRSRDALRLAGNGQHADTALILRSDGSLFLSDITLTKVKPPPATPAGYCCEIRFLSEFNADLIAPDGDLNLTRIRIQEVAMSIGR